MVCALWVHFLRKYCDVHTCQHNIIHYTGNMGTPLNQDFIEFCIFRHPHCTCRNLYVMRHNTAFKTKSIMATYLNRTNIFPEYPLQSIFKYFYGNIWPAVLVTVFSYQIQIYRHLWWEGNRLRLPKRRRRQCSCVCYLYDCFKTLYHWQRMFVKCVQDKKVLSSKNFLDIMINGSLWLRAQRWIMIFLNRHCDYRNNIPYDDMFPSKKTFHLRKLVFPCMLLFITFVS